MPKRAYELRISDWSSDLCSSYLDELFEACDALHGGRHGSIMPDRTGVPPPAVARSGDGWGTGGRRAGSWCGHPPASAHPLAAEGPLPGRHLAPDTPGPSPAPLRRARGAEPAPPPGACTGRTAYREAVGRDGKTRG